VHSNRFIMVTGLLFKWEDSPALCMSMSHLRSLFVCLLVAVASSTARHDANGGLKATTAVSAIDILTIPARGRHALGRIQVRYEEM
jgi:hypothetical protein